MAYPLQERYINLLTDFDFKRVFGTEPNKVLLIVQLLSRTLGELPNSIAEKIDRLSWEQLNTLSQILLEFSNLEDLLAWLESVPSEEEDSSDGSDTPEESLRER
ncbi:MAG TPA: DUF4351 domain-containing protein [Oscillatoriales cyanobacterium M59_W2019_021]|nr:MAG: DUF4351 domain-containing protein [Cyanobacteria bacterium J055]HIK31972.1 DUF4351 domain-containing protein [Oscillatoriales cyanobacterium M4454_W2019_049]HIK49511.1 DUF4351 domain-containing protein [Oscillatoriales cyanobacterium M59_W2019_021]